MANTLTQEHKDKISKSRKGQPSAMKDRTKESGLYPKKCGFQEGHENYTTKGDFKKGNIPWNKGLTKETDGRVKNYANKLKGENNGGFGKVSQWKRVKYNDVWMKSSWEVKYAKYLDKNNIKWEYEPTTFRLSNTTYTPDFKINNKKYIEIKGWFSPKSYLKIKEFISVNPEIDFTILLEKDLKKMGVLK